MQTSANKKSNKAYTVFMQRIQKRDQSQAKIMLKVFWKTNK